jgi:UDP-N-acetylmuramoyl-tripeptide--D-alanyl-D-alanine ligase
MIFMISSFDTIFFPLIFCLWVVRTVRQIFFWLYLWQLKEYHIGRFLDHFHTTKGRQIFLNRFLCAKVILAASFFVFPRLIVPALFALYLLESGKTLWEGARGIMVKPVFTPKVFVLTAISFMTIAAAGGILFVALFDVPVHFFLGLLLFDIFTPAFVSLIVLALQPLAVFGRSRIIAGAKKKRALFPRLIVIGITGSYGKTSTKEFLTAILSEKFHVAKTKAHQNSEVGVAQCILNDLTREHEVFVCEMGAYGKGGITLLAQIAKPQIGIVTGVNEQHFALFGSMENLLSAEGGRELIESLPEKGIAVVNWDNHYIKSTMQNLNNARAKIIKYSTKTREDVWAENIHVERESVSFLAVAQDGDAAHFLVNVLGWQYVPNLLAAAAVAKELGMTMAEIADACKKITPELAGMQLKKGANGLAIVDSTYSANPDGVIAHLEYLKLWPGRRGIIMPCLIELGRMSREVHRRIGRKIAEVCDFAIITTQERFGDIQTGAIEAGMEKTALSFSDNPKIIGNMVKGIFGINDVLLLEGRISRPILNALNDALQCSLAKEEGEGGSNGDFPK